MTSLAERTIFENFVVADPAQINTHRSILEARYAQIDPGPVKASFYRIALEKFRVEGVRLSFRVRAEGGPHPGMVAIAIVVNGGVFTRFNRGVVKTGDVLFCGPEAGFEASGGLDFEWFGTAIPKETFADYVRTCHEADTAGFMTQFISPGSQLSRSATVPLRKWWRDALEAPADSLMFEESAVAESFMQAFCGALKLGEEVPLPVYERRRSIALSTEDFFKSNIDCATPISAACKNLGVSRRTLEYAFQEVFEVSPARYLQCLRLNEARRLLREAEGEWGSIKAIAYRCGFNKLSNFSAAYRELFGELPKQTLRSSKPEPKRESEPLKTP